MLTDLNILKILNLNNPNSAKIPIIVDSQLLKPKLNWRLKTTQPWTILSIYKNYHISASRGATKVIFFPLESWGPCGSIDGCFGWGTCLPYDVVSSENRRILQSPTSHISHIKILYLIIHRPAAAHFWYPTTLLIPSGAASQLAYSHWKNCGNYFCNTVLIILSKYHAQYIWLSVILIITDPH